MFYNLLSNRAIQVGILFFVLVVGGSLLYSWHAEQTTKAELAERLPIQQHTETLNAARTAPLDVATPGEVIPTPEDTEPQMSAATDTAIDDSAPLDERETLYLDDFFAEELPTDAEAPESVDFKTTPAGYPMKPYWDYPENEQNDWSYEQKLIDHVLVKLWQQGTQDFLGGSIELDTQRVRPHYRNTLYVQWEDVEHPNGSMVKIITRALGAGDVNWQQKGPFDLPPPSVHLIDIHSTEGKGIDPFTFLTSEELPK